MCGRYVSPDEASIEREFNLVRSDEKADCEAWLPGTPEEAWETLSPYPDDLMVAWSVSTRVNTPKNNDAKLVEPV